MTKVVPLTWLECPCCGLTAAEADDDGLFYDGADLDCDCDGQLVVGENQAGEDEVYVSIHECDCGRDF